MLWRNGGHVKFNDILEECAAACTGSRCFRLAKALCTSLEQQYTLGGGAFFLGIHNRLAELLPESSSFD